MVKKKNKVKEAIDKVKAKIVNKNKAQSTKINKDIIINMGTPRQPDLVKEEIEEVTEKKKEEVINCRCCGRSNKKCGYPTTEELYSLPTYYEGTYICGDCLTEAGGPFGNGLELQQRVLILLNKDVDFGL